MLVHYTKKPNNPETLCGVKKPLFTTIDKGLVTCYKCIKAARKLKQIAPQDNKGIAPERTK